MVTETSETLISFVNVLFCQLSWVTCYLLKAERAASFILINLPSLELLHCLFHSQLSHLHPLLQRDELPLSRGLHACKGVMVTAHVSVSHQPYRCCKNRSFQQGNTFNLMHSLSVHIHQRFAIRLKKDTVTRYLERNPFLTFGWVSIKVPWGKTL